MKHPFSVCVCLALAATTGLAQSVIQFECAVVGPLPAVGTPGNCEGVTGTAASVSNVPDCAMPSSLAKFAVLRANGNAGALGAGATLPRPIGGALTEVRMPLEFGTVGVAIDYSWVNSEGPSQPAFNDGYDISVCAADGSRLALIAAGDTFSHPAFGCTGLLTASVSFAATPAGAYLSAVSQNVADTAADSVLRIDNVRRRAGAGFECQAAGSAFGAVADCERVTGLTGFGGTVTVSNLAQCGFPSQGAQYARLVAGGFIMSFLTGGTITRPLPSNLSEIRIPVPTGATSVAFDYAFFNSESTNEPTYIDGFDVSLVDGAGNRLQLLVKGDAGATNSGCNGVQRFVASIPAAAPGTFVSFVVFNEQDTAAGSELLVDDVCFIGRPRLVYSSPLGAGSLAARIDCGTPNSVFYTPITLAPGAFPYGFFYGVDISLLDVVFQISLGAPFIGVLDASGSFDLPPYIGLPSGLTLYANVLDGLTTLAPGVGVPVSYTIP